MKNVKKLHGGIRVLFVLSVFVSRLVCCTQDYEQQHTVILSDTIAAAQSDTPADTQISGQTRTGNITFSPETASYCGQFAELKTDYAKSELTTDFIAVEAVNVYVTADFFTDTSGDMVRFVIDYYKDGCRIDTQTPNGKTLAAATSSLSANLTIPDGCDSLIVKIQAKYDKAKGGSPNDLVRFAGLKVLPAQTEDNSCEDSSDDAKADDTETLKRVQGDSGLETDDSRSDETENGDNGLETNNKTHITFSEKTGSYDGVFVGLKTDYAKSELSTDFIAVEAATVFVTADFFTDTSGDMVRFVIDYYKDGCRIDTQTPNGKTLAAAGSSLSADLTIPDGCDSLVVKIQAKYDKSKGGSPNDLVRFAGLKVFPAQTEDNGCEDSSDDTETLERVQGDSGLETDDSRSGETEKRDSGLETNDNSDDDTPQADHTDEKKDNTFCPVDGTSDAFAAAITDLRTDYAKRHVETDAIIADGTADITIVCAFCADSDGDRVRLLVCEYDDADELIKTATFDGILLKCAQPTEYVKIWTPSDKCAYFRLAVEAKYESKSGGSQTDRIAAQIKICR